tara:strand:- start:175 stop:522 length:348 start_codon:yes stop_codon:yes gene_type:complete
MENGKILLSQLTLLLYTGLTLKLNHLKLKLTSKSQVDLSGRDLLNFKDYLQTFQKKLKNNLLLSLVLMEFKLELLNKVISEIVGFCHQQLLSLKLHQELEAFSTIRNIQATVLSK